MLALRSPNATETLELAVTPARSVTSGDNLYSEVKSDPPLTEQFRGPLTAEQEAAMMEIGVTDLQCGSYHFSQQVTHLQLQCTYLQLQGLHVSHRFETRACFPSMNVIADHLSV